MPVIKIGEADYYERLKAETDIRTKSDRHVFENEVKQRFSKHKIQEEIELNKRRKKLLELLNADEMQFREQCREKINKERESRKLDLLEKAKRLQIALQEKDSELVAQKLAEMEIRNDPCIRKRFVDEHAKAIQLDRKYILEMKQKDLTEQAQLDAMQAQERSLFEEQLQKGEEHRRQQQIERVTIAQEYARENENNRRIKLALKEAEIKEGLELLEKVRLDEARKFGTVESQRQQQLERKKAAYNDLIQARKVKAEQAYIEKELDAYFSQPMPLVDKDAVKKSKQQLKDEQLKFLEYQRKLAQNEECIDRYLENLCANTSKEMQSKEIEIRKKKCEKLKQLAKENALEQLESIAQKEVKKRNAFLVEQEEGKRMKEKQKLFAEIEELEMKKAREKMRSYAAEIQKQYEEKLQCERKLAQEESERESKAVLLANCEYQHRFSEALTDSPLYKYLHPWRKGRSD